MNPMESWTFNWIYRKCESLLNLFPGLGMKESLSNLSTKQRIFTKKQKNRSLPKNKKIGGGQIIFLICLWVRKECDKFLTLFVVQLVMSCCRSDTWMHMKTDGRCKIDSVKWFSLIESFVAFLLTCNCRSFCAGCPRNLHVSTISWQSRSFGNWQHAIHPSSSSIYLCRYGSTRRCTSM